MKNWIDYLHSKTYINLLIVLTYFVAVVAPHKTFGTYLNLVVFKGVPRAQYNFYVLIAAITVLAIYILFFIINANKQKDRKKLWLYMVINIGLSVLVMKYLFVINIETVHFPQYALLAILLFPLIGNYTGTMIWSTLFGVLDEAYQYFYLAPKDTFYFDFNDVITDIVGTVFGLLLLRSIGIREKSSFLLKKSTIWYGIGLLISVVLLTHVLGLLSIYPNENRAYHLLREWPEGFWTIITSRKNPEIIFHVIRPIEGLILTIGLWVIYSNLRMKTNG